MCLVCIEYAKGKMTPDEALNALHEIASEPYDEHAKELLTKLLEDSWHSWNKGMPQTDQLTIYMERKIL